jgi:hypothetical protein
MTAPLLDVLRRVLASLATALRWLLGLPAPTPAPVEHHGAHELAAGGLTVADLIARGRTVWVAPPDSLGGHTSHAVPEVTEVIPVVPEECEQCAEDDAVHGDLGADARPPMRMSRAHLAAVIRRILLARGVPPEDCPPVHEGATEEWSDTVLHSWNVEDEAAAATGPVSVEDLARYADALDHPDRMLADHEGLVRT